MFQSLISLFTARDRVTLGILVVLMAIGGILEGLGIGLLFPYVAILQDPGRVAGNPYLSAVYSGLGFESYRSFGIALSLALLALFTGKGVFAIWTSNYQMRFVNAKQVELGRRLLAGYLNRPYAFFLTANTSTLIGNLTTSLGQLCGGVLQSALTLAAEVAVSMGIIALLVFLSPAISLGAILVVGILSVVLLREVRAHVARYATENDVRWKAMIRAVNESLSGAKEVQVLGRKRFFVDAYTRESHAYAFAVRRYSLLSQLPRVVFETTAIAGMVLFVVLALLSGRVDGNLFPLLAVFAVATVRIVPSANRIVQAWNAISFYRPAILAITGGLTDVTVPFDTPQRGLAELRLRKTLAIAIRSFAYPTDSRFRLQDIQLVIEQGHTIAVIGHSGSGKTTLVDLVLGLFPEFDGEITVDGQDIRGSIAAWRHRIGYIPQSIYLCDDTIVRNVAFGVPDQDIRLEQVKRAVSLAGLDPVIQAQALGLETVVGDRGIRLSGGERQRIGIARALYHDPDLLILDEATSALDNETELRIVDSILGLSPAKTIIVIAHRLSTVKHCDCVYLMQSGRIIDQGRFDDLAERHPDFVNPAQQQLA